MLRRGSFLFLLVLFLVFTAAADVPHVLPELLRIGLATGQSSLTLRLPGGTAASGPAGTLWRTEVETVLTCGLAADGTITAPGMNLGEQVRFSAGAGLLGWGSRFYRGALMVRRGARGLALVNEVGLEDYLRGVVPAEVNPAWPAETLKAMAVAARTFAVGRVGCHGGEGFDLCAAVHCQVYKGSSVESPATDEAVAATAGQVITYDGRLASTYYHAASGGHTEDVEAVWTTATPWSYLRGVPDPTESYAQWRVELNWDEVEAIVAAKYPQLGGVSAMAVLDRTAAGRIRLVELAGPRDSVRLGGESFRFLFSLPSALVEIEIENGAVPAPSAGDLAAAAMLYALAPATDALWFGVAGAAWRVVPVGLVLTGRGKGHGIGLSQYGAKSLAELGYTWVMILKYYYQGIEVEDWRPPQALPPVSGGEAEPIPCSGDGAVG